ncbi:MAG: ligand-binding sensor domain-containing protein/GGDEF domain-containing protein [Phenylobacterium sp.]|jgi:ligand-binding sensor domain-containing protein/GGDEF domain-containing protein
MAFAATGQELNSLKTFGVDNPLSYQAVRAIAQDQQGFMWFGSQGGLQRYDGHNFVSFHHDAARPQSLSSGVINALLIDSDQRIWVGTRGGGLNLYREDSQDFEHITSTDATISGLTLSNDNVNVLMQDSGGNIWVGTDHGLNILSRQNGQWQLKTMVQDPNNLTNSLPHNNIKALIQTSDSHIWAGTKGGGIGVFDLQGRFVKAVNAEQFGHLLINALHQDKQGNIWIGTVGDGLIKTNILGDDFVDYHFNVNDGQTISSNTISAIYQDGNGRLWVATDRGLSIYDQQLDGFRRYNHAIANANSLANDVVLTFFEGQNQMMWIGTFSGVNRWDPNMATFSQYHSLRYPVLTNDNITSFTQQQADKVYFSTYSGGVYQLSVSDNQIIGLPFNKVLKDLRIMALLIDGDDLWVGTRTSGLHKVNLNSGSITQYQHDASNEASISANSVTDIIKDRRGDIWASTFHRGINRLERDGTFSRFVPNQTNSEQGPSTDHILHMLEDNQGYLWLGTYGDGINRFDPLTKTFIHLKHDESVADSLSSDQAWILFQDRDKNLWIGTESAGLNRLSWQDQQQEKFSFTHLDVKDGMKSHTVYGINQDSSGHIWLSTDQGIARYATKADSEQLGEDLNREFRFKHFDSTHGLLDMEYSHGALFAGRNKTLYFGSPRGFISVDPDNMLNRQPTVQVQLTNILKLNEPMVFDHALSKLDALTLTYRDQLISFDYVGLNYADPESTKYKYRLLGFDQQWINAGKLRRATYTNLPAGNYQLQVVAANNDNVWSESALSLDITVNPAPWNTWWAYLLYAMFTALLLLTYSRLVNRKLLAEQLQKTSLKQQVEEKTREFQLKNVELEQANKQLENAATTDKLTGVNSRRYLDIYIEQASQLMAQIHQNIMPVQRHILPRLYLMMVRISNVTQVSSSQLINLTDLLLYSRNPDDLVIRWSEDTFAVIGYEKEQNARELATRLSERLGPMFKEDTQETQVTQVNVAYSFYPFNFEQPMALSWDQVSVLAEFALNKVSDSEALNWLGLYAPAVQPFNYLDALKLADLAELAKLIKLKHNS